MQNDMPTFALSNHGCKVNQYDGQIMRERMAALGWREVPFRDRADVYVVNTCTVTARADEKGRKEARRAVRRNPGARVIVTGCGAVSDPRRFAAIAGVSAVLTREQMVQVEEFLCQGRTPAPGDAFGRGISRFAGHTRGFLRIQDGCDACCAYCLVPRVRGPSRSRPLRSIREEAQRLADAGHIEIVLTGIHVGRYRAPAGDGAALADVARAVLETPEVQRLRISSIEALEVSGALLELAAGEPRFCPYFHLPLQSGDDATLSAMRREYTSGAYLERVGKIRAQLERPSIGTDVMVGFPGETETRFARTLAVCRAAGFSRIHIFPFSLRPGTPAAALPDRIPAPVIRERVARLKALADELALDYKRQFLGATVRPLVEHRRDRVSGRLAGWSARYLRTEFEGGDELMGRIVPVRVRQATARRLLGAAAG